jgi:hypothetical protein
MGMEDAADIGVRHQLRQLSVGRQSDLVIALAQLWRDEFQAQRRVNCFLARSDNLLATSQSFLIENIILQRSDLPQLVQVTRRASGR